MTCPIQPTHKQHILQHPNPLELHKTHPYTLQTILQHLTNTCPHCTTTPQQPHTPYHQQKPLLKHLYQHENHSLTTIANTLNTHPDTIKKWLLKHELTTTPIPQSKPLKKIQQLKHHYK